MAQTLEQAQKQDYKTYYLCECDHCKKQIVVCQDELDNFYGVPEHEKHESAWKCPVCGHVNIENTNKDMYKKACYQNGSQNIMFELNDAETKAAREFIKEHKHEDEFKKEGKLAFSTMGQQFTYIITPGGLGNSVTIKCNKCGATKDITDIDSW